MVEYISCYSAPAVHWGPLPTTRLASREILMSKILKSGQGQHSVYSVPRAIFWAGCINVLSVV
jgi:hypothetical protein